MQAVDYVFVLLAQQFNNDPDFLCRDTFSTTANVTNMLILRFHVAFKKAEDIKMSSHKLLKTRWKWECKDAKDIKKLSNFCINPRGVIRSSRQFLVLSNAR